MSRVCSRSCVFEVQACMKDECTRGGASPWRVVGASDWLNLGLDWLYNSA